MNNSIFKNFNAKKINKNNKKIIFVGNCYQNKAVSSATGLFPVLQLYVEINLIKEMQNSGHDIIYCSHPGNNKIVNTIFKNFFNSESIKIEISNKLFENKIDDADAIAYYYPYTSTFISSLKSDKSIYYFDLGLRDLAIDSEGYINKNFLIINADFIKLNENK